MIAVMGASGRISEQLLQQGEKIRVLGRSSHRLAAGEERRGVSLFARLRSSVGRKVKKVSRIVTLQKSDPLLSII
jgi:hypothetical protein